MDQFLRGLESCGHDVSPRSPADMAEVLETPLATLELSQWGQLRGEYGLTDGPLLFCPVPQDLLKATNQPRHPRASPVHELMLLFSHAGTTKDILMEQGTLFVSRLMQDFCCLLQGTTSEHQFTVPRLIALLKVSSNL